MANPPNQRGKPPALQRDIENIIKSLDELKERVRAMQPGHDYELFFDCGKIEFRELSGEPKLLPTKDTMKQFFETI